MSWKIRVTFHTSDRVRRSRFPERFFTNIKTREKAPLRHWSTCVFFEFKQNHHGESYEGFSNSVQSVPWTRVGPQRTETLRTVPIFYTQPISLCKLGQIRDMFLFSKKSGTGCLRSSDGGTTKERGRLHVLFACARIVANVWSRRKKVQKKVSAEG
jgi:hypothetical protein